MLRLLNPPPLCWPERRPIEYPRRRLAAVRRRMDRRHPIKLIHQAMERKPLLLIHQQTELQLGSVSLCETTMPLFVVSTLLSLSLPSQVCVSSLSCIYFYIQAASNQSTTVDFRSFLFSKKNKIKYTFIQHPISLLMFRCSSSVFSLSHQTAVVVLSGNSRSWRGFDELTHAR